ncbi:Uncharacterised protein [Streptococcus pneumoniae]|nr:Uncharacterised protein [Streptococcus pneumoniae]
MPISRMVAPAQKSRWAAASVRPRSSSARSRATETTERPAAPSAVREPTSLAVRVADSKRRTSGPEAVPASWAAVRARRT